MIFVFKYLQLSVAKIVDRFENFRVQKSNLEDFKALKTYSQIGGFSGTTNNLEGVRAPTLLKLEDLRNLKPYNQIEGF